MKTFIFLLCVLSVSVVHGSPQVVQAASFSCLSTGTAPLALICTNTTVAVITNYDWAVNGTVVSHESMLWTTLTAPGSNTIALTVYTTSGLEFATNSVWLIATNQIVGAQDVPMPTVSLTRTGALAVVSCNWLPGYCYTLQSGSSVGAWTSVAAFAGWQVSATWSLDPATTADAVLVYDQVLPLQPQLVDTLYDDATSDTLSNLAPGIHRLWIGARNLAGESDSATNTFTIEPAVTFTQQMVTANGFYRIGVQPK